MHNLPVTSTMNRISVRILIFLPRPTKYPAWCLRLQHGMGQLATKPSYEFYRNVSMAPIL